jgi:hypothetical protein
MSQLYLTRLIGTVLIIALLFVYPPPEAFSQQGQPGGLQDMLVNGGFEGGFQEEFGVGYGWGAFSNGNAVVGWNFDDWPAVVGNGQYSQRIEIKEALSQDRYAGIYQTISVVPGEQYKLTVQGLIRSDEGDIGQSDYGYRLQYAVDYNGDTAWELVPADAWQELPWDEQPMELASGQEFQFETYDVTITATSDKLTLFIRGWKKWINDGTGIFSLDNISVVGPAPEGFQSPTIQAAAVNDASPAEAVVAETEIAADGAAEEPVADLPADELSVPENAAPLGSIDGLNQTNAAPQGNVVPLPVTGYGEDSSVVYVVIIGIAVLLALFVSAVAATLRWRSQTE